MTIVSAVVILTAAITAIEPQSCHVGRLELTISNENEYQFTCLRMIKKLDTIDYEKTQLLMINIHIPEI